MPKNIFVVGAKPNPVFPDVKPEKIYAANGGIVVAQQLLNIDNIEILGVVYKGLLSKLRKRKNSNVTLTLSMLEGCKVSQLIIAGGGPKKGGYIDPKDTGIVHEKSRFMSRKESLFLKLRFLRLSRFLDKGNNSSRLGWLLAMKKTRDHPSLRLSTGLLSTLLAIHENKGEDVVVWVIGIGLDIEGQFYNKKDLGRKYHLYADMKAIEDLSKKHCSGKLRFTDPGIQKYLSSIS